MPDPAVQHAQAIHALIVAAVTPAVPPPRPYEVYLGEVTAADHELVFPYLVVWPPPSERPTYTLAGYGGEAATTTQVSAVGRDTLEAIVAMDRASAALHRVRPAIAGRACGLITQVPQQLPPPRPDERVRVNGRPVYFTFALFRLGSSPAAMPVA